MDRFEMLNNCSMVADAFNSTSRVEQYDLACTFDSTIKAREISRHPSDIFSFKLGVKEL